jgi:hypothetical protein
LVCLRDLIAPALTIRRTRIPSTTKTWMLEPRTARKGGASNAAAPLGPGDQRVVAALGRWKRPGVDEAADKIDNNGRVRVEVRVDPRHDFLDAAGDGLQGECHSSRPWSRWPQASETHWLLLAAERRHWRHPARLAREGLGQHRAGADRFVTS